MEFKKSRRRSKRFIEWKARPVTKALAKPVDKTRPVTKAEFNARKKMSFPTFIYRYSVYAFSATHSGAEGRHRWTDEDEDDRPLIHVVAMVLLVVCYTPLRTKHTLELALRKTEAATVTDLLVILKNQAWQALF